MAEKLVVDPNSMTIGDLEDFEDACGMSMDKAFKSVVVRDEEGNVVYDEPDAKGIRRPKTEVQVSAKVLKTLVWIVKRADNPEFTLDDARSVKISELELTGTDEDEQSDPTEAANAS